MENSLATLRPQLEKIKLSLIRRLPAMQELLDKVNYVLAIPHDTTIYTAEQKAAIASLKKDVQAYIRERAAKAGIVEDLNVHIQRIRDGNRALTELINKTIWNTSSIPDVVTLLNSLKANLANWAISYPQMQPGVKSVLEVVKQAITTGSDPSTSNLTVDSVISLKEKCATVIAMTEYVLSHAETQESFLKKSTSSSSPVTTMS